MGGLVLPIVPEQSGAGLTLLSPYQMGDEHPGLNRLTDALYMVRFKVRPGVHTSDPEQPGGDGRRE